MKTKNLAVSVLAAVLVTALWYTFLLKPIRAQTSKVKADTTNERSKLQPLQAQLTQAKKDASHEGEFKAELQSLQSAMPDSPALAAFIRDANGIAAASGVVWQSVTHAPPVLGVAGVMSISVGISVRGTYAQSVDYLGRLAQLQRLIVVDTVGFNPASDATASGGAATSASGASSASESTGPFSGGDQVTLTISGRIFETGSVLGAVGGTASSTGAAPAAGTTTVTAPALNNS